MRKYIVSEYCGGNLIKDITWSKNTQKRQFKICEIPIDSLNCHYLKSHTFVDILASSQFCLQTIYEI